MNCAQRREFSGQFGSVSDCQLYDEIQLSAGDIPGFFRIITAVFVGDIDRPGGYLLRQPVVDDGFRHPVDIPQQGINMPIPKTKSADTAFLFPLSVWDCC